MDITDVLVDNAYEKSRKTERKKYICQQCNKHNCYIHVLAFHALLIVIYIAVNKYAQAPLNI